MQFSCLERNLAVIARTRRSASVFGTLVFFWQQTLNEIQESLVATWRFELQIHLQRKKNTR